MKTLIIIPTYNEIENLKRLLEEIFPVIGEQVEVLVVDDGSPDGTGHLADAIAAEREQVKVLHREKKEGLGPAYCAGFRYALERGYDAVVEMDADFSHHPRYLPKLLELLQVNDFVIGSRYVPGGGTKNWGLIRRLISKGGSLYSQIVLQTPIEDFTGGFNGWRRSVLEAIGLEDLASDGYSFQIELKVRAHAMGFRYKEFPIVFEDRKVGSSKMNAKIVFEALGRVWQFRMKAQQLRKRTHDAKPTPKSLEAP